MLDENKNSILNNPQIAREESILRPQPAKKSKAWIFKIILVLLILISITYLFFNTDKIQEFANNFFSNILK